MTGRRSWLSSWLQRLKDIDDGVEVNSDAEQEKVNDSVDVSRGIDSDRVEGIAVFYDRFAEIEMKHSLDSGIFHTIRDYHEEIRIDRSSDTIEHFRRIPPRCDIRNTYHIVKGVSGFLDDIDADAFSKVRGNPPDVCVNPHRTDRYRILITTRHGGTREVTGTFDKDGLPSDWPEFAENLRDFLASHDIGYLLDDRVYGKARRRKDDLVFCNVVFHDGGRKYCYLADDDDFDIGDAVVVPVGQDNHEAFVRIESIEYHPAEEAPWPVDKIKHILRRFDADKDRNLPGNEDE